MFLDKKDFDGLIRLPLSEQGCDDLRDKLTARLPHPGISAEAFAITGDFRRKSRIRGTFSILDQSGIPYTLDPGSHGVSTTIPGWSLRFLPKTWVPENQVLGGGTYRLAHLFGGEDTPSCGFAIGFDRVMVSRGDKAPPRRTGCRDRPYPGRPRNGRSLLPANSGCRDTDRTRPVRASPSASSSHVFPDPLTLP